MKKNDEREKRKDEVPGRRRVEREDEKEREEGNGANVKIFNGSGHDESNSKHTCV